jgi:hypothetical protein
MGVRPETASRLAELHSALAEVYRDLAQDPAGSDRAVLLPEAARLLGMSLGWIARRENWQKAGGYRDADGRVKVPLSAISRYVQARKH